MKIVKTGRPETPAVAPVPPPPGAEPPSTEPDGPERGGAAETAAALAEAGGTLAAGVGAVRDALKTAPRSAGVYRMIAADGAVLYVGKAKALHKRLVAYVRPDRQSIRIRRMIARTRAVELITTQTEAEALLLEANLIKRYKPRYNILLRDDKSFPGILIPADHPFPPVLKHRGARTRPGAYFGPFASGGAVNETLAVLQRAFLLRTCSDSVFESRTRPCLLFQIKRCTAPCVGRVDAPAYALLVEQARAYLKGESRSIQQGIARQMEEASAALDFERAALLRDRIHALTALQARQSVNVEGVGDADVVASHQAGGQTCVQVFFVRGGRNYGNRAYFPSHAAEDRPGAVLEAFLGQFYQTAVPAPELLVSERLTGARVLAEALTVRAGRKVEVRVPQRGPRRALIDHAVVNARDALSRRMAENATQRRLLYGLAEALGLDAPPQRIEVYDNSHTGGQDAFGVMIVAVPDGFMKSAYRKFRIRAAASGAPGASADPADFNPGDDYSMMRQMLTRRFARAIAENPDRSRDGPREQWPDLVLIDGGAGHLSVARQAFDDLGIEDVALAAVAKGPDRNAGRERIYRVGLPPLNLGARDPVLYFIQRLRDEAHRFAIGTHRAKRGRTLVRSVLDEIPGIGARRKRALLNHFGSAEAVAQAGPVDLATVDGVSRETARKIYDWFHPGD